MGWRAGAKDDSVDEATGEATEATQAVETAAEEVDTAEATTSGAKGARGKRSVYLVLGGLVVAGIAAGLKWMRGLPKDEAEATEAEDSAPADE